MRIPVFDARAEYERDAASLEEAALRVLASGRYIIGPEVEAFEEEAAEYLGVPHAVSCASGTDALWLALRVLGVGPGDGVILPAFTFFATASAVLNAGAIPIPCDIDPETYNLAPEAVAALLEGQSGPHRRIGVEPERVRAVLPVHLFGQPAEMNELCELADAHDLALIEDAAQAFGASYGPKKVGTFGRLGCFSFFPTKNLGGFGDGGMVTTADEELAERVRMLRAHGSRPKYHHRAVGTNSRLDELQATLLRIRLRDIDTRLKEREELATSYDHQLAEPVRTPQRRAGRTHSFNLYVIDVPDRDRVAAGLEQRGIGTAVHYPCPVHLQDAVAHLGYRQGDFPVAERACVRVLTLPSYPSLSARLVAETASAVLEVTGNIP